MKSRIKFWLNHDEFIRYFKNTLWLLSDKVVRMFAGLIAAIVVARYLGPEQYGFLSYALSIATLFAMFNHLGLDGLSVRYLVEKSGREGQILGTVFALKMLTSVFAFSALLVFAWLSSDHQMWLLLLAVSFAILLKPFEVIDFFFQSRVKGKYGSLAKSASIASATILRLLLVLLVASPLWFGIVYSLEFLVLAVALVYWYCKKSSLQISQWHFDLALAKEMLTSGWLVMFGAIFATIYKKVDQAMLLWLSDAKEVGVYAVAAQLSDIWSFVPLAIVASLFPKLIELHKVNNELYRKRLQHIFDLLFLLGLGLAVCTTIVAEPLISLLFGSEFMRSADILVIHIWSTIFVFMRALFSKWIHLEKVYVFSMMTQGAGALLNVVANYFIIPIWGAEGAAWTTLVSYATAAWLSLILHNKTRAVFIMMTKSCLMPFRIKTIYNEMTAKLR